MVLDFGVIGEPDETFCRFRPTEGICLQEALEGFDGGGSQAQIKSDDLPFSEATRFGPGSQGGITRIWMGSSDAWFFEQRLEVI